MLNSQFPAALKMLFLLMFGHALHAARAATADPPNLDNPFQSRVHVVPNDYCTPLFSRSHPPIGCSTPSKTSALTSPLLYLPSSASLSEYLSAPPPAEPLTAVLPSSSFTNATVTSLIHHSISSIILLDDSTLPFSSSSPSPWCPTTSCSLLNQNLFSIPITLVSESASQSLLISLSSKNSLTSSSYTYPHPRYESAFNYYMGPESVRSEECLNWVNLDGEESPQCKPLGGQSVYGLKDGDEDASNLVILSSKMDSKSFFHYLTPGANDAAASLVTVLLATREIGKVQVPEGSRKIGVALFQGESYDSLGSLKFFHDLSNFTCSSKSGASCLSPLQPDLTFTNISEISSMLTIDQIGVLNDEKFYSHNYNSDSSGLDYILRSLTTTNTFSVSSSSSSSLPPTPLTSLISKSSSSVTGAVLSGYDEAYVDENHYTRFDTDANVDLNAIAAAATLSARAVLAEAVRETIEGGVDAAIEWAEGIVPEINENDEDLLTLSNCFFTQGSECDILKSSVAAARDSAISSTGYSIYSSPLGTPPNYYVNVYSSFNSQPYVVMNGGIYGATEDITTFESSTENFIGLQASELEITLKALLTTYLNNTAHFHPAIDTALTAKVDESTSMWNVADGDTPLWTEPNWGSDVALAVFNAGGDENKTVFLDVLSVLIFGGVLVGFMQLSSKWKKQKLL
ncbi:hypothetical protein TrLO_g14655 [Triparma laevis f. longispina]|uniref:Nicastrin n=1 Tax=Triparma laevis f. longispina TaxID=1714387 RepID=A0A9W7FV02_9STRA|nr:hypothetical protein TrLO_g14655 [Triparma laevis f. longispina]